MAAVAAAARLTEAHRLKQAHVGAQTVQQMLDSFHLLNPEDLDATIARWLRTTVPIIQRQRDVSSSLAANYMRAFRSLEVGVSSWTPTLAGPAPIEAVTTSLTVTGPVSIKAAVARGVTLDKAIDIAQSRTANAAMRHVLGGGRDTIVDSIRDDKRALGWARATSGNPCAFCAMVASRGAVYRDEDSAGFEPHDGCACEPEPIYDENADLPPGADDYRQLWNDTTSGLSGDDAIAAFRTAFDKA